MNAVRSAAAGGVRDQGASILVAAIGSAFGVVLLDASQVLAAVIGRSGLSRHSSVGIVLAIVALVFIVIAVYVAAIVTGNTISTVIAGRTARIALFRLIGATAGDLRRGVAVTGLAVGAVGAGIGLAVGTAVTAVAVLWMTATGTLPPGDYPVIGVWAALPVAGVVASTWLAGWAGSRRVLAVSPIEASGRAEAPAASTGERGRPGRTVASVLLMGFGFGLVLLGVAVGLVSPVGVLIAVLGGVVSFTGIVVGAHLLMPPVLRSVGRMLGRSAPARLAAANAVRHPQRSARSTIGVVIGVTLITMFAVAAASYRSMVIASAHASPEEYAGFSRVLDVTVLVFSVMIGFSALIAAIGLVNDLAIAVTQRRRELGVLRALGLSGVQVRLMVLAEAAAMTAAAVLVGSALGVFYGWAGAQSLLGSIHGSPGLVPPVVPPVTVVLVVIAAAVLALVSSVVPARRATRMPPLAALEAD